MGSNPKLDLVIVQVQQNLVRFCQFVLKILSGNKILTSFKGHKSIKTSNNHKLDFNVDVYTKIWSDFVNLFSRY